MTIFVLTFNEHASKALGANTRLRVKSLKRGGQEYLALRPSYRVSGKNQMIRTTKQEDETIIAEIPEEVFTDANIPLLQSNSASYLFQDVGYGWFIMKQSEEELKDSDSVIVVTKRKARASDAPPQDSLDAANDSSAEDAQTTDPQAGPKNMPATKANKPRNRKVVVKPAKVEEQPLQESANG